MDYINENVVLCFYLEQIEKNNIVFLDGREEFKERIKENIVKLRDAEDMHDKIQTAKNLWKSLFTASMSYIDSDMRGYDKLFTYFDEYVNFEELIFASDSFYRDHTLHCLWVYFLGEYLTKNEEFSPLFNKLDLQSNSIANLVSVIENSSIADILKKFTDFGHAVDASKCKDSIWCVTALTHDLGYPIKKIYKINNCIGKVLPYFSLENYNEFNFNYSPTQQHFVENFIKLMTMNISFSNDNTGKKLEELTVRIFDIDKNGSMLGLNETEIKNLTNGEREILKDSLKFKCVIKENLTKRLQFFNDFEQYQHGIMSAFLLMKTVKSFSNINFNYTDNLNLELKELDVKALETKMQILSAISDHTNEAKQIKGIDEVSDMLILIDELEEFSRISRANMNRQFIREFCKSDIYFKDGVINIDFIFDNENIKNLDPEKAFKGRCKRFLSIFNINKLDEDLKIKLRCIGKLSYDNNVYSLEIAKKYANITINDVEQDIPKYLKSNEFYTKAMYMKLS
ncbi:MAG: hypothetical protein ACREV6_10125 [Clostridium sp.]|uniref:hypothetical protein n=1 Tax=Clostridium sp. TaxID=1506 RepID=UPI003D6D3232